VRREPEDVAVDELPAIVLRVCATEASLPRHAATVSIAKRTASMPARAAGRTVLRVQLQRGVARIVVAQHTHQDDEQEARQQHDEDNRVENGEPVDLGPRSTRELHRARSSAI